MANVVKWLTHRVVVPTGAGSIPVVRPIFLLPYTRGFKEQKDGTTIGLYLGNVVYAKSHLDR